MSRPKLLRCVAPVALLLAACGGNGELSADDYVDDANEICREGNETLEEDLAPVFAKIGNNLVFSGADPTEGELEEIVDALVDSVMRQIDQIHELDGPSELEAEVDQVLDETSAVLDEIAAESPQEYFEIGQAEFAQVDARFEALGLTECG